MIEPNKASEGRALPVGCACYPRHHQALRNRPNITDNSSQEDTKLQVKANAVKARINGFCKHHMQKQLMTKCEQHVYESSSLRTPVFLQHASPTPWKPPNGPTWHPINHPMERATKYCGSVGGDFFFFSRLPRGFFLTFEPHVQRRWCCGSEKRPWLTGPSAL